ncbi:lymphocyte antigen 75-like [Branchiostoma floridae x Branchiostoma japonicum]
MGSSPADTRQMFWRCPVVTPAGSDRVTLSITARWGSFRVPAACPEDNGRESGRLLFNFTSSAGKDEHYLAIAVPARVVRLTPESWLDRTTWEVGLLGCPMKENHVNYTSCGKGWTMSEERCYQKFASPLVWWAAERYCQALGGHLAAVNTPRENKFLRDNIGNGWIGMKIADVLIKKESEKIANFTWSDGSPAGDAFREQDISFDGFPEYIWRFNDPFCAFLEDHGPWSLQPCSLIEKEFICEKDPASFFADGCETTANYNYTELEHVEEAAGDKLSVHFPDMTACDDCMARETSCGYVFCGSPDQYRCGLIYTPGYPHAFPSSAICLWTIEGPPGSYVTLMLLDVDLPCGSRVLQVRDRFLTVGWNTIHGLCRGEGEQKRYVSSSNEMRLVMLATSHIGGFGASRGFIATYNVSKFSPSRKVEGIPDDAGFICPCGWRLFRRNCYHTVHHHVRVNWEEADAKCREFGANLTSIADRAEMEFLHLLLVTNVVVKRIVDPTLYIGLYDIHLNRTFVWTDGIPVTYMDWSPMDVRTWFPQPDGAKMSYCVAIVMKNVWGTDQWYDVSCDERATRSFICKRAAGRVTRPGDNG